MIRKVTSVGHAVLSVSGCWCRVGNNFCFFCFGVVYCSSSSAMKLTLRPEWRLWPLASFLGILDLKTGVTVALLFAVRAHL